MVRTREGTTLDEARPATTSCMGTRLRPRHHRHGLVPRPRGGLVLLTPRQSLRVPTERLIKARHEVPGRGALGMVSRKETSCGEKSLSKARFLLTRISRYPWIRHNG